MAQGKESSSSTCENDSDDDEKPSDDDLLKQVQFFDEVCTKQRKQISELKGKYTKIKKNCDNATDRELIINDLKSKLASSQNIHENFLIEMKNS